METIFNTIATTHGTGNVTTQLFTCATAVNPILAAGMIPTYAPVSPDTISLDPHTLTHTPNTKAVVIQNTFGLIDTTNAATITRQAHNAGIIVIEDSAHCVTRLARNEHGEPLADISIHSFGAEKMLPTKFGGALWVNPNPTTPQARQLNHNLTIALQQLPTPNQKVQFAMKSYRTQLRIWNRLGTLGTTIKNTLTKTGLFEPPITPAETQGQHPYNPATIPNFVAQQVLTEIHNLDTIETKRAQAVNIYRTQLAQHVEIPRALADGTPLVRFPFYAPQGVDAETVFAGLAERNVRPGRWYRPALFPGPRDNNVYYYEAGAQEHQATEALMSRVLNLPTDVSGEEALRIAQAVKDVLGR